MLHSQRKSAEEIKYNCSISVLKGTSAVLYNNYLSENRELKTLLCQNFMKYLGTLNLLISENKLIIHPKFYGLSKSNIPMLSQNVYNITPIRLYISNHHTLSNLHVHICYFKLSTATGAPNNKPLNYSIYIPSLYNIIRQYTHNLKRF